MPRKDPSDAYPIYGQDQHGNLYAIMTRSEMYLIRNRGTNVGCEGISVDYYKTRKMVLKHLGRLHVISRSLFANKTELLFTLIKERFMS